VLRRAFFWVGTGTHLGPDVRRLDWDDCGNAIIDFRGKPGSPSFQPKAARFMA